MYTGKGANHFRKTMGVKEVDEQYLITEKAKERIKSHPLFSPAMREQFYERGCVIVNRTAVFG